MTTLGLTGARLGSLIAVIVAIGFVGEIFAGESVCVADSGSGLKPASRLVLNASGNCGSSNSRSPADRSPFEAAKEIQELSKAAEAGDLLAQLNLGRCYESGRGVSKDNAQAIKWFRKAADGGFGEAQYTLGCCYNGDGGFSKDPAAAAKWWGKAAAQGYSDAQYCLGLSYFMGEGVAKNSAEAAKWWKKAAEQNHAGAQYFLGLSYSLGLGVPKIQDQAVYWLRKAVVNGNENAMAALKKLGKSRDVPAKQQSDHQVRQGSADKEA